MFLQRPNNEEEIPFVVRKETPNFNSHFRKCFSSLSPIFFQKQKIKDENIQSSKSIKPTVRLSNQLTKHSSIRSTFYYYPYGPSIDGLVIDGFAVLIFVVVYLDFEL